MPKLIGNSPQGGTELPDNFFPRGEHSDLVKLSYSQMIRMPADQVYYSYDTTDEGSRGSLAKRWYHWFAKADDIKRNSRSTANMAAKADAVLGLPVGRRPETHVQLATEAIGFPPSDHR